MLGLYVWRQDQVYSQYGRIGCSVYSGRERGPDAAKGPRDCQKGSLKAANNIVMNDLVGLQTPLFHSHKDLSVGVRVNKEKLSYHKNLMYVLNRTFGGRLMEFSIHM